MTRTRTMQAVVHDGAGLEIARPSWAEVPALAAGKILVELTASALLALLGRPEHVYADGQAVVQSADTIWDGQA